MHLVSAAASFQVDRGLDGGAGPVAAAPEGSGTGAFCNAGIKVYGYSRMFQTARGEDVTKESIGKRVRRAPPAGTSHHRAVAVPCLFQIRTRRGREAYAGD